MWGKSVIFKNEQTEGASWNLCAEDFYSAQEKGKCTVCLLTRWNVCGDIFVYLLTYLFIYLSILDTRKQRLFVQKVGLRVVGVFVYSMSVLDGDNLAAQALTRVVYAALHT